MDDDVSELRSKVQALEQRVATFEKEARAIHRIHRDAINDIIRQLNKGGFNPPLLRG